MKGILSPMNALQYHSETKRRVFSQYTERKKKRRKEEKKSTGLIFFSADLGIFSSGTVLNLLQIAGEDLLSK